MIHTVKGFGRVNKAEIHVFSKILFGNSILISLREPQVFNSVHTKWASLVTQTVKNLPAMQNTCIRSLGWKEPLEKGMATHFRYSFLENLMDRGAWQATVHGVTELDTTERLSLSHNLGRAVSTTPLPPHHSAPQPFRVSKPVRQSISKTILTG